MCTTLLQLYVNNGFSKCNKNPNVADTMMVVISLNRMDVYFETCLQPFNIGLLIVKEFSKLVYTLCGLGMF